MKLVVTSGVPYGTCNSAGEKVDSKIEGHLYYNTSYIVVMLENVL